MTEEFLVSWKGETLGPFTRDEIESRLRSGEITPLHAIRRNGELIDAARWLHSLRPAKSPIVSPPPPEPIAPPPPPLPPPPSSFPTSKPVEAVYREFSDPFCVSNPSPNLTPPPPQSPNNIPFVAVTAQNPQTHDIFAVLTFASAMVSMLILPIVFVPICYICSIVSYYRLKDNPNLKGKGLRLTGAIIGSVSLLYLLWSLGIFKI
jgi:hypothetical protein